MVANAPVGAMIVVPSGDRPVGGVPVTVTVVAALAVPVGPVQARLNVLVLVSRLIGSLPETALAPDQPPEAVQEVALVEDQTSVDDPPLVTDVGFAVSDTVDTGGGGGAPFCGWLLLEMLLAPPPPPPPPQAAAVSKIIRLVIKRTLQ